MTVQVQPSSAADEPRPGVGPVGDLDVKETLAAAGQAMVDEHRAQVRALDVDLHFAVLHSTDPQAGRPPRPALKDRKTSGMSLADWEAAGNKLVQLGGDGTPTVQDLPICELAIARGVHEYAARSHLAAALDLAYRLPLTWQGLRDERSQVWVAVKIARLSRHLDRDQVRQVDAAVAKAMDESPGRVLTIAEAAVLRADPDAARKADEDRRKRRFLALGRSDEDGLRKVFGLIDAGDAAWLDAMLERIAAALEARPDLIPDLACRADEHGTGYTRDELRAEAFGWMPHLEDALALLNGTYPLQDGSDLDQTDEPATASPPARRSSAQRAVVFVHLSQAAVEAYLAGHASDVVGRVEDLGPMLVDQLRRLLGHADSVVKPVIDLNTGRSVNQYEFPADVQERSFLRTTGDVFPHAQSQSRCFDGDHPAPYEPNGPPGQTGDENHAPLGRRNHRAKTHLGYQVIQIGLGRYVWRTPHGLCRLVDGSGTHVIDEETAQALIEGQT